MKLKKCKIVMLTTNDEAGIGSIYKRIQEDDYSSDLPASNVGDLIINQNRLVTKTNHKFEVQHLYILSDDEIQVDDSVTDGIDTAIITNLTTHTYSVRDVLNEYPPLDRNIDLIKGLKKIIATTDPALNLPTISKGFIEKYVKKGGIDEVMVKYETLDFLINDIPVIRNNKISIRPVDSNRTTQMNLENVRFGYPMVHDAPLNTWCSSIFIEVNGYIVSFAGDDGNRGEKGEKSIRHYLSISKGNHDLTEELGFKTQDVTFLDFVNAIKKVESL